MRRQLKSNKSIIIIVIIAIFTLSSYFFDQMAIRQEDNLRNSQIKLENLNVEIDNLYSISNQLTSIGESIISKYMALKRKRNFWIKSLLLVTETDTPSLPNKVIIKSFQDPEYINYMIKNRFIRNLRNIHIAHFEIDNKFYEIFSSNEMLFQKFMKDENGKKVFKTMMPDFETVFQEISSEINDKNFKKYYLISVANSSKERDEAIEKFSLEDWLDLHKYGFILTNKIEDHMDIVDEEDKIITDKIDQKEILRQNTIEEITKNSNFKNTYILSSIISQILSLLFLLILFRVLIVNKL